MPLEGNEGVGGAVMLGTLVDGDGDGVDSGNVGADDDGDAPLLGRAPVEDGEVFEECASAESTLTRFESGAGCSGAVSALLFSDPLPFGLGIETITDGLTSSWPTCDSVPLTLTISGLGANEA